MFMPANSAVGQPTVKKPTRALAPHIACTPRPYALRTTTPNMGTERLAPVLNMRAQWRTRAVFSWSGPTMIPGQSIRLSTGMSNASQSCRKRAPLSAPSESMAPAR